MGDVFDKLTEFNEISGAEIRVYFRNISITRTFVTWSWTVYYGTLSFVFTEFVLCTFVLQTYSNQFPQMLFWLICFELCPSKRRTQNLVIWDFMPNWIVWWGFLQPQFLQKGKGPVKSSILRVMLCFVQVHRRFGSACLQNRIKNGPWLDEWNSLWHFILYSKCINYNYFQLQSSIKGIITEGWPVIIYCLRALAQRQ